MSRRSISTLRYHCALLALLVTATGCGSAPPTPPSSAEVKPFLSGELKNRLLLEPMSGLARGPDFPMIRPPMAMAPPPLPPMAPGMPPIPAPPAPPPGIRSPGVTVPAELTEVTLGEVSQINNIWNVNFEGIQELGEDLYVPVMVPEVMGALAWSDVNYRNGREQALLLREPARTQLVTKALTAERSRSWAMSLKYPKGTKFKLSGILSARSQEGRFSFELISAIPKDLPAFDAVSASRIPAGVIRYDRDKPGTAAADWDRPFAEFLSDLRAAKDAEIALDRTRTQEIVLINETFVTVMEGVKDEASARAAIEPLDKLAVRALAIFKAVKNSPVQPSNFAHEIRTEFSERLNTSLRKSVDESKRIMADKPLLLIVGPAIVRVAEAQQGKEPSPVATTGPSIGAPTNPATVAKTADILWDYPGLKSNPGLFGVQDVALSRDGKRLVTAAWRNSAPDPATYTVWDLTTGARLASWQDRHRSKTMALSHDGSLLASTGFPENNVRQPQLVVWEVPAGTVAGTFGLRPQDNIWTDAIAFDPAGRTAYWLSWGIAEVDVSARRMQTLGPEQMAQQVAYSPDSGAVAVTTPLGEVKIWSQRADYVAKKNAATTWKRAGLHPAELRFTADGKQLFALAKDKDQIDHLVGWEVRTKKQLLVQKCDTEVEKEILISPDGRFMVSPDGAYAIGWSGKHQWLCKVADKSVRPLKLIEGRISYHRPIAITPDNILVLVAEAEGVKFLDLESGEALAKPVRGAAP